MQKPFQKIFKLIINISSKLKYFFTAFGHTYKQHFLDISVLKKKFWVFMYIRYKLVCYK